LTISADERGIALPLALMVMTLLGALAATLLRVGAVDVQIASNHLRATQAQYLAEAGVAEAFTHFRMNPSDVSRAPAALTALALPPPGGAIAASGIYTVRYQQRGEDTVLVVATGTTTIGAGERVLRALITTSFSSDDAIRTRKSLTVSGVSSITGRCGTAHANTDLALTGTPTLSGSATASGAYSVSGNPTVGPDSGGGRPRKPVPPIDPAAFLAKAKDMLSPDQLFQLKADGTVLDGNGTALPTSGQRFQGWRFNPGSGWGLSGSTAVDGTYYIEGDATVSGNPGTPASPWTTTIIATGDVEIVGTPVIKTHLRDTLFVAGQDVKISGNPSQGFEGLIAAHEQVQVSGNPTIYGFIIAEHFTTSATASVRGNPQIVFDCGLNPPLNGPPVILALGP
jgi:hypothetical protein